MACETLMLSKRPVLCDHRQCLTFHERQPLLCFCGKSPTPTDVWTMPQESGQQTEHWTSNPHKSNQIKASVIWPKRAATVPVGWNIEIESISAGVHVRNECRVSKMFWALITMLLPKYAIWVAAWLVVSYWPKSQVCVNQHFTWSSNVAIQNLEKWVANIV